MRKLATLLMVLSAAGVMAILWAQVPPPPPRHLVGDLDPEGALRLRLPDLGPRTSYSIYSYSCNRIATEIYLEGANNTEYSLVNASKNWIVRDPFPRGFHPAVKFVTMYQAGSKVIGQWSGKNQIIPALQKTSDAKPGWCAGPHKFTGMPPKLPGDGEKITSPAAEMRKVKDGKDALWFWFNPVKDLDIGFLVVPSPNATKDVEKPVKP